MILTAGRWYASYLLSAAHIMQLLAERHIDVSACMVLNWGQTFGPQLAKALHYHRRRFFTHEVAVAFDIGTQNGRELVHQVLRRRGAACPWSLMGGDYPTAFFPLSTDQRGGMTVAVRA